MPPHCTTRVAVIKFNCHIAFYCTCTGSSQYWTVALKGAGDLLLLVRKMTRNRMTPKMSLSFLASHLFECTRSREKVIPVFTVQCSIGWWSKVLRLLFLYYWEQHDWSTTIYLQVLIGECCAQALFLNTTRSLRNFWTTSNVLYVTTTLLLSA